MDNNKFNGQRLKSARLYRGYTLADLAKELGISKQAISQYENNETQPEAANWFKIINVLNFPRDFFYESNMPQVETFATHFRSLSRTKKIDRDAQKKKGEYLAVLYEYLSEFVNFPPFSINDIIKQNIEEPENLAIYLRNILDLGQKPIPDMVFLLEKLGIIVSALDLNTLDIDAYTQKLKVKNEYKYLVVLSNDKKSYVRRNFNCAHELGHILMHSWIEEMELESVTKLQFNELENQADNFAGAFLLPEEAFTKDVLRKPSNLEYYKDLKLKWKVSIGAMLIRAKKLGILSPYQYQYLIRQYSAKHWRTKEPYDDDLILSEPMVLKSAARLLLSNNKWTGSQFVDKFYSLYKISLPVSEIEYLLNLDPGELEDTPKKEELISLK